MNLFLSIPVAGRFVLFFVVGVCLGSLANLAIYQLAWHRRAFSPWGPRHPDAPPRRWSDRIPVLGWLGLRRESGVHGRGFWIRPMLLELLVGAGLPLLYWWEVGMLGLEPPDFAAAGLAFVLRDPHHLFVAHACLIWLMLVASWIDIDEKTISDAITVPGALVGLVLVAVWPSSLLPDILVDEGVNSRLNCVWLSTPNDCLPWRSPAWTGAAALGLGLACFGAWCVAILPRNWRTRHGLRRAFQILFARLVRDWTTYAILVVAVIGAAGIVATWRSGGVHWAGLLSGLVGMAIGGGTIWMIRILGSAVLHREAMGFGDVTLMAMMGAYLGWQAMILIFFFAPFAGLVIGLAQWLRRGESEIPYGPFLCLAAVVTILAWSPIWAEAQNYFALGWVLLLILVVCLGLIVVLLPLVRWVMSWIR